MDSNTSSITTNEIWLQSLPPGLKLLKIAPELQQLVCGYLSKWDKISYWKNRFTQDVLPFINKGYRWAMVYQGDDVCNHCYIANDMCEVCKEYLPANETMHMVPYIHCQKWPKWPFDRPDVYDTFRNFLKYRYERIGFGVHIAYGILYIDDSDIKEHPVYQKLHSM